MDILLDSNVLLSDPWLRSARFGALFDFVQRTGSRLLLPEVVELEVAAVLQRRVQDNLKELHDCLHDLERDGVDFGGGVSHEAATEFMERWKKEWNRTLKGICERIPVTEEAFREALRRAIERIPPCSRSGKEYRDALVWLALFHGDRSADAAFISENVRDFADETSVQLREELREEIRTASFGLWYYRKLDHFLKEKAEPIAHITWDWIETRLDDSHLGEIVWEFRDNISLSDVEASLEDGWHPIGTMVVGEPEWGIDDWYVWEHIVRGEIDLFLTVVASYPIRVDCEREEIDPDGRSWIANRTTKVTHDVSLHIACAAEADRVRVEGLEDFHAY